MLAHTLRLTVSVLVAAFGIAGASIAQDAQEPGEILVLSVGSSHAVLPGTTSPHKHVTLGAVLDGRLGTLLVHEGTVVQRGDVLAKLDDQVVRASLELAREEARDTARIDRTRAELERSERNLKQTLDAFNGKGANSKEVKDARTNVALAKADLAEAQEQHRAAALSEKLAEARLEEFIVRAPFDGVVLDVFSERGAVLRTGDPIAELAAIDTMRADMYLPADLAMSIVPGNAYALELDSPISRVIWARAVYAEPRIEPTSNTMRVVFNFETPDELIPAGVLVTLASRQPNQDELAFARGERPGGGALATVEESN